MRSKKRRKRRPFAAPLILPVVLLALTAAYAAPKMTDNAIRDAVEDELLIDRVVELNDVDVTVTEGVVTLSGSVDSVTERERALQIARTVRGVRSVVSTLKVVPNAFRTDEQIASDVRNALLVDPATESYEVTVGVRDGVVTVEGKVDSWHEAKLVERVAGDVQGVLDVVNKLDWEYDIDRSALEIESEIEARLEWDVLVDDGLVEVKVDDEGRVALSGVVGSAVEKARAEADAWVAGTKAVDVSELEVKRWARDEELRSTRYAVRSDPDIKNAVQDAMLYDPRVSSFDVNVEVDAGIVTIRGKVDNLKARRAAAQDARNTLGVLRVKNRIRVRPETLVLDERIEEDVARALRRSPYVDRYEIVVDVVGGEANLYGTVDTFFEKAEADDVASGVVGVTSVDNHLVVEDMHRPFAYDPYIDDWYLYNYPWYHPDATITFRSDSEIRQEIESQLWWSPFVDADEVNVRVQDGVATLTGTVDSWTERSAARENAIEGGAIWVENDLQVRVTDPDASA
jgi:osmotically-inducible protein OsmY